MWIFFIILTILTQTINAQHDVFTSNNRGANFSVKPLDEYTKDDYIAYLAGAINNTQLPIFNFNANSRNSDRGFTPQVANPANINEIKIKSPTVFDVTSNPQISTTDLEIPIGETFNAKLFEIMSLKAQQENLVYSPISLQTLLAFIFTMSSGKLFEELHKLLALPNNRTHIVNSFENILQTVSLNTPPSTLIMANKLYYDYRFGPIDPEIRKMAKKSFSSELEQIDFSNSKQASNLINSWVSERTFNLIRDIVTPSSISGDTSALLLNSIYFKSEWQVKFATLDTEIQDFFVSKDKSVPVDMMFNDDVFRYGDFPENLRASVVELPYVAENVSMMLILPKDIDGLADLERKLRYLDLEELSQKLQRKTVTVKLPKFKAEFEADMIKPLQQLGLNALFNNDGSLDLFKNQQRPLIVDQLKHKSFINVNEAGTEAAATTVGKYVPLSVQHNKKYFVADHPFVFIIRNSNTTFFIGHVVKF